MQYKNTSFTTFCFQSIYSHTVSCAYFNDTFRPNLRKHMKARIINFSPVAALRRVISYTLPKFS